MHDVRINEIKGKKVEYWMFKVHNHVCKYLYAILLRISLKRRPKDCRVGLLRHTYQQNAVLQWSIHTITYLPALGFSSEFPALCWASVPRCVWGSRHWNPTGVGACSVLPSEEYHTITYLPARAFSWVFPALCWGSLPRCAWGSRHWNPTDVGACSVHPSVEYPHNYIPSCAGVLIGVPSTVLGVCATLCLGVTPLKSDWCRGVFSPPFSEYPYVQSHDVLCLLQIFTSLFLSFPVISM